MCVLFRGGRSKNWKKNRRILESMRIADVLNECDEEEEDGGENISCKRKMEDADSPFSISCLITRWLPKFGKKTRKKKEGGSDSGMDCRVSDSQASSVEMTAVAPATDSFQSSELSVDFGRKQEDFSFNLGMGVGLAFLLARSSAEFNKMVEVREQMEMLLKEIRGEVQRKHTSGSFLQSNNNISYTPSRCFGDMSTRNTNPMPTYNAHNVLDEAKCGVESDRESEYAIAFENSREVSRGQMEAELEVELERLQHNWEGESSSTFQDGVEDNCDNYDPSFVSSSTYYEEDYVPFDENPDYQGVCPQELERKLHELLEARQQERIAELKYALECAEKKLLEKEMELDLWKETQWAPSLNKDEASI